MYIPITKAQLFLFAFLMSFIHFYVEYVKKKDSIIEQIALSVIGIIIAYGGVHIWNTIDRLDSRIRSNEYTIKELEKKLKDANAEIEKLRYS